MEKLDGGQIHILELIDRDKDEEGWTKVSDKLYPFLVDRIPAELIVFKGKPESYKAKLTEEGNKVIASLRWLNVWRD